MTPDDLAYCLKDDPTLVLMVDDNDKPDPIPVAFGSVGYEWADAIVATSVNHKRTKVLLESGSFFSMDSDDWTTWENEGEVVFTAHNGSINRLTDLT
jgi:hypothetical protein